MYKCLNCGEIFEEAKTIKEDWGESFSVCPYCNGDYEEVHRCQECEEWHTEDELYSGWCEKCLRKTINYDTFFDYCEANKREHYLLIFVMEEILEMDPICDYNEMFYLVIQELYKNAVDAARKDILFMEKRFNKLIDACIRFIMDDDGECGRENYADWLNKREEKK